jgi:sporulation protein YlmC with PRC-barrel domain
MKTTRYGVAVMLGLLTTAAVQAADQSTRATTRDRSFSAQTTTTTQNDRAFGQVERWSKLKGREIIGSDNQKLGKLEDTVVDLQSGHILYAIVGSGGVRGAGEKKFAIAPGAFTDISGNNVHFNGDKAKLNAAPAFTKEMENTNELGKTSFVNQVHQYFGQSAWWQGANSASAGEFQNVHKTSDLLNENVKNVNDEDMGKVDNMMLNLPAGRVAFVVLSPASNLALGNNLYALPPNAFSLNKDGKSLTSNISKDKLAGAPHFDKNNWTQASDPTWAAQVYQYYGKEAYFQTDSSTLQPTGRSTQKSNKN